ncbi:6-carboxyhexanoate--CoA ligase [Acetonema longum]|uniref:6-carboxyhexanoate--CoA ligase n=1 Tax=Acetonema longum DSM 6540 TaxID=1009370 RepID=F7NJT5_9FIRM|nr:6-carboxyhexanoate--CoA ligase [Acetonema longum]EGO63698.1 6-carboxyhexanoate--CoA ligase [Acetonema longum DSM 6540]
MLYSVRMRAAQGGTHEDGGRHISGAERLVPESGIGEAADAMLRRAMNHSRGKADFINITVEAMPGPMLRIPLPAVETLNFPDIFSCRLAARQLLVDNGIAAPAVDSGFASLDSLADSMRGAMLLCAKTGIRLDQAGMRGVRVSRQDCSDREAYAAHLQSLGLSGVHVREALVLASKVLAAPGVAAELCWSDDPEYTAGYISVCRRYIRLPHFKPYGSPVGGRVFFLEPGCDVDTTIEFLQNQPVLVDVR